MQTLSDSKLRRLAWCDENMSIELMTPDNLHSRLELSNHPLSRNFLKMSGSVVVHTPVQGGLRTKMK